MNDNDIIKGYCKRKLCPPAQEIIKRQQAEIERLGEKLKSQKAINTNLGLSYIQAKTEAVKEFAERFKKKYEKPLFYLGSYEQFMREVDNLVKEMTEQSMGYESSKTEGNG